jgi:hypothetical protein
VFVGPVTSADDELVSDVALGKPSTPITRPAISDEGG